MDISRPKGRRGNGGGGGGVGGRDAQASHQHANKLPGSTELAG
jgi:hypothetical protein